MDTDIVAGSIVYCTAIGVLFEVDVVVMSSADSTRRIIPVKGSVIDDTGELVTLGLGAFMFNTENCEVAPIRIQEFYRTLITV